MLVTFCNQCQGFTQTDRIGIEHICVKCGQYQNNDRIIEDGNIVLYHRLIENVCRRLGCVELSKNIVLDFSRRMTRAMGYAKYRDNRITLSIPIFKQTPISQHKATIIHEVCHLVTNHLYGKIVWNRPHGKEWKHLMKLCNQVPYRCWNHGEETTLSKLQTQFDNEFNKLEGIEL